MFVTLINLKHSTFLRLKIIFDTLMSSMKHQIIINFLKSVKINTEHCFPTRMFQSISGHSYKQSIAHYSSAPVCLQYYVKLIWESPSTEETNFTATDAPFIKTWIEWPSYSMQSNIQAFRLTELLWKTAHIFSAFSLDLWILQFNSAFTVSFHSMRHHFSQV